MNYHWDKEEFEDLVARGITALYETNESKKNRYYPKEFRVNQNELLRIRKFGCYFPPEDRDFFADEFQVSVDGFPSEVCISFESNNDQSFAKDEYLTILNAKRIQSLPGGVKPHTISYMPKDEAIYSLTFLCPTLSNKLHIQKTYFTLDKNGQIHDTYFYDPEKRKYIVAATGTIKTTGQRTDKIWAACVLNLGSDNKHLWNVTAKEGIARATFGVYPEQIQSLFYAREMPMTETGRKRPILHWVAAHHRRLKNGIEIDIEKHLRGINEFVYQGTKFQITRPLK